ncbi:MAG: beta-glucosidase [Treponema sp. GWB1_62_6]|nr:MAG: beta-glucosidase [Treponema sp. GWC1_61_84]OHE71280.1 MAG: beta-glucosidase [Treponema sp. RIFOXYC1_FULL_61_9]OHE71735.1 MAG: beta-glucosidase [Treponema sp. GWB1_62_6]HCM28789.1 beta-glucosidase [Treponema sp.]
MSSTSFPDDFLWGSATASFQVEGAAREDGRSESIWDRFCRIPGKVHAGDNGDVSCDQYHRYPEDIALMKKLGIKAYRFSVAWPRIVPGGTGETNPAGIAYYKRLIAALLEAGIEPVLTLYHWDLPQSLEDSGGWTNRATAEAFAEFARTCYREFGPSVRRWITLNEPFCAAYLGYLYGTHAPGIRDAGTAYRAVHHLNLAHGLALKAFRETGLPGEIGIVWNLSTPRPATRRPEDRRAAERIIDHDTRMFTDPVLGKGYPASVVAERSIALPIESGDMALISRPIDFIGLNYYNERPVSGDADDPRVVLDEPSCERVTDMDWPVVPEGLLRQLRWITTEAGGIPLYITENGSAERDAPVLEAGGKRRVHDTDRIAYLRLHLDACARAIAEGIPLKGYFVWSFIDNFEWAFGYSKRFGIVYCDYATMERIPKDSFYYYRDAIAGYGL